MKKVLMILLAFAMVFSMAGVVSADEVAGESGDSGKVEVSHTIPDNCVVFMPVSIPLAVATQFSDEFEPVTLTVNKLQVDTGHTLYVTMKSSNGFEVKNAEGDSSIAYSAGLEGEDETYTKCNNGQIVLTANAVGDSATMKFFATQTDINEAKKGGKHTDTLTFTYSFGETDNDVQFVKSSEELSNAIADGAKSLFLGEGTYTFPNAKLDEAVTLDCTDTVFSGTSSLSNMNGATVVGATFSDDGTAVTGTINGNFKDCIFDGSEALRWCYSTAGTTATFENCEIKTDFRGVHFDDLGGTVIFKNCKINGFNAFGGEGKVIFENCIFGSDASSYNGLNIYLDLELNGCTFNYTSGKTNFIDMEGIGKTLIINNCYATLDGSPTEITNFIGGSKLNQNTVIIDGNPWTKTASVAESSEE